jgi:protein-S-isoprenylcysteine O-methyltransferase Ste14
MSAAIRIWFIALYTLGIIVALVHLVPGRRASAAAESRIADRRRWLPALMLPIVWLLPWILLVTRVGSLGRSWPVLRLVGVAVSLYALPILATGPRALGRMLVPGAAVFADHALVTTGPFRFLRHPIYSAVLALWLGAALGTLNVILLVLWVVPLVGVGIQARAEEELLRAKFGPAYADYAARTGALVPRWPGAR